MRWKELYDIACVVLADINDGGLRLRDDGWRDKRIKEHIDTTLEQIAEAVVARGINNEEEVERMDNQCCPHCQGRDLCETSFGTECEEVDR